MWESLPIEQKQRYQTLIKNFASLSEAFAQKAEGDKDTVAPIVNSKFQETVFQRAFDAVAEDISNSSFDASIRLSDEKKYLIGIKSFGVDSGDQKIAQFKADSAMNNWGEILSRIKDRAKQAKTPEEANNLNHDDYLELATQLAQLRNARIESSKEMLKGFQASNDVDVEAVYHVLMPSKKGNIPKIHVGETTYAKIDTDHIRIIGATTPKNPTNFKFEDDNHQYKYTSADSQLLMAFNNKEIIHETWDVHYVDDAFALFEHLHDQMEIIKKDSRNRVVESVSWMLTNKKGEVEASSGFNAWDGAPKTGRKARENLIEYLDRNLPHVTTEAHSGKIKSVMTDLLLNGKFDKKVRDNLIKEVEALQDDDITNHVKKGLYRPVSELYIPLPDAKKWNTEYPDFFGEKVGLLQVDNPKKLKLRKEHRTFRMEFLSSGDVVETFLTQDYGKGIQSVGDQQILGEWILRGVFQLGEREPLTAKRLTELHINAIRMNKYEDKQRGVGLEFIWIDQTNPPEDAWGWVAKSEKSN